MIADAVAALESIADEIHAIENLAGRAIPSDAVLIDELAIALRQTLDLMTEILEGPDGYPWWQRWQMPNTR